MREAEPRLAVTVEDCLGGHAMDIAVGDDQEVAALPLCGHDVDRLAADDPAHAGPGDEVLEPRTM